MIDLNSVTKVAIYPAIGIARVGNSPEEYFIGPTIPGVPATDPDEFRDGQGRIKRQAPKFFIYGLDHDGNILGELNESHGVTIDWRVEVANKKASWYNFDIALDIPAAEGVYNEDGVYQNPPGPSVKSAKRNIDFVSDDDRKKLMIEGGVHNICGPNQNENGGSHQFVGTIGADGTEVYLGELRTDDQGRLIFLGGHGHSASFNGSEITTFANNNGWYDDTSDGPVDAVVTFPDSRQLNADGGWVVTSPPNYAVGVQAFSTGYDLLVDVVDRENALATQQPSFYKDIYPILKHLTINQWVNAGVVRLFGWGSAYEFDNEALIAKLNDNSDATRPFRQTIFEWFRDPSFEHADMRPQAWPPLYGDAVTLNSASTDPREWFAVTALQYQNLSRWARGEFTADAPPVMLPWEDMSPQAQANGLTEAALEETLGGPFHPGCEFTWPMRHAMMYNPDQPFRIKRRSNAKEDFGPTLDHDIALSPGGPLDGSSPGDITKWMAVPWQTDTSSCLSAYSAYSGEYLPTFWPARVPNDVLTQENYELINGGPASDEEKIQAFSPDSRKKWLRDYIYNDEGNFISEDRLPGMTKFTEQWDKAGIILKKPLSANPDLFPEEVWVETGRSVEPTPSAETVAPVRRPAWMEMNPRKLR